MYLYVHIIYETGQFYVCHIYSKPILKPISLYRFFPCGNLCSCKADGGKWAASRVPSGTQRIWMGLTILILAAENQYFLGKQNINIYCRSDKIAQPYKGWSWEVLSTLLLTFTHIHTRSHIYINVTTAFNQEEKCYI